MASTIPEILAPAGDQDCFLAALAAGADAVYLGLKQFSARMEAKNFGLAPLARLTELAHANGRRVYVAMNTMLKPGEGAQAYRLIKRLAEQVLADGLILQDLGMLNLARQAGFTGRIAFSTLANVSNPAALLAAKAFGADRVIIPRELSLEEMRLMGDTCPPGLELECFVHGALCYCVSGRCYWSSYMGGKSGLRGRCVQPCRRNYERSGVRSGHGNAINGSRFFSCQDLELGASARSLLSVPHLASWKIEGRKKGPHYVYFTVRAYSMLRDSPDDASAIAMAQDLLAQALGRPGVKARFLKPVLPMAPGKQTSSGLLAGKIIITPKGEPILKPRFDLLSGDYLRIGVEDERWHATLPVKRSVPRGGVWKLSLEKHKTPPAGTPVYLIDRKEPGLEKVLGEWRAKLQAIPEKTLANMEGRPRLAQPAQRKTLVDMVVTRGGRRLSWDDKKHPANACWLWPGAVELSRAMMCKTFFWLPPDLWPENESATKALVTSLWRNGARHFVCNSPWQRALFPEKLPEDARLIAGPFCNVANGWAVEELARAGFTAAFASPELSRKDFLALPSQSPLPLGLVLNGYWPMGLSRFGLAGLTAGEAFRSPRGEVFWSRNYGGTVWLYSAWPLNLEAKRKELVKAGYSFFATLRETPPETVSQTKRAGLFNWDGALV